MESRLLKYIPDKVRELHVTSPAYCLFLWYQDLSAMDFTPSIGVGTVELWDACFSGRHRDEMGDSPEFCVWSPQQSISGPFPGFPLPGGLCNVIAAEANECYSLMCEREGAEEIVLLPFRSMMHRVAQRLNTIEWSEILRTTDDFIVLASDYIGYWFDQDIEASIGATKLSLLQEKKKVISWGE
jgi:hypothetical protein